MAKDEANDFLFGSGAKAFSFEEIGDKVSGRITEMKPQQQTDIDSGEPVFWKNGDPKMMLRITLQTDLQESDDDEGFRSVYLRGGNYAAAKGKGSSSLVAVKDAVRRSGAPNGIEIGGYLTMEFSGYGVAPNKGKNQPKLYSASYMAPDAASVDLDSLA